VGSPWPFILFSSTDGGTAGPSNLRSCRSRHSASSRSFRQAVSISISSAESTGSALTAILAVAHNDDRALPLPLARQWVAFALLSLRRALLLSLFLLQFDSFD
jgi:hypothetical protein